MRNLYNILASLSFLGVLQAVSGLNEGENVRETLHTFPFLDFLSQFAEIRSIDGAAAAIATPAPVGYDQASQRKISLPLRIKFHPHLLSRSRR
jgi:hypothetical protein